MAEKPLKPSQHDKKEVREALEKILKSKNWRLVEAGHWGHLRCSVGCCDIAVDHTPRVKASHAKDLLRAVRRCPLPDDDPRSKKRRAK